MNKSAHVRLIAILHLVHGFVAAASAIGLLLMFTIFTGFKAVIELWVFPTSPNETVKDPELWFWVAALALIAVYVAAALLFTVPAIVGGYGMLKQKLWARKFVLVSAAVAALNVPFGTALAVYTFWFLLGDNRRDLYDKE
ncbi:MAG TPA: hypothetical protein VGO96_01980 [Pyrinomonadaceae bacterium]|jgi:hypothetical protein|nr:hypothetical protein [Pyrinomonadaceae bacterium]